MAELDKKLFHKHIKDQVNLASEVWLDFLNTEAREGLEAARKESECCLKRIDKLEKSRTIVEKEAESIAARADRLLQKKSTKSSDFEGLALLLQDAEDKLAEVGQSIRNEVFSGASLSQLFLDYWRKHDRVAATVFNKLFAIDREIAMNMQGVQTPKLLDIHALLSTQTSTLSALPPAIGSFFSKGQKNEEIESVAAQIRNAALPLESNRLSFKESIKKAEESDELEHQIDNNGSGSLEKCTEPFVKEEETTGAETTTVKTTEAASYGPGTEGSIQGTAAAVSRPQEFPLGSELDGDFSLDQASYKTLWNQYPILDKNFEPFDGIPTNPKQVVAQLKKSNIRCLAAGRVKDKVKYYAYLRSKGSLTALFEVIIEGEKRLYNFCVKGRASSRDDKHILNTSITTVKRLLFE